MTEATALLVRREGAVVRAVFNRPHRRNAMNAALVAQLDVLLDELEAASSARILVLEGAGGYFCAGLDLGEVAEDERGSEARLAAQVARNTLTGRRFARIAALPQAVLARVRGGAFAGGLGFVCAADLALCDGSARFCAPEVRRGLVAAQILPWLVRRMGLAQAQRLVLRGDVLDATAALAAGLVHEVLPDETALDAALAAAIHDILCGAPGAVRETKALLAALGPVSPAGYAEAGAEAFAHCVTGEAVEGITAFKGKRPPAWEPRQG